jgi:hypothetical protein
MTTPVTAAALLVACADRDERKAIIRLLTRVYTQRHEIENAALFRDIEQGRAIKGYEAGTGAEIILTAERALDNYCADASEHQFAARNRASEDARIRGNAESLIERMKKEGRWGALTLGVTTGLGVLAAGMGEDGISWWLLAFGWCVGMTACVRVWRGKPSPLHT